MKNYYYENWEIITDESLDMSLEKEQKKHERIYAFRAPFEATKCITELNENQIGFEITESLNQLYSKDYASIFAVNLNIIEQQFGADSLKLFLNELSRDRENRKRKKKVTMLGLGDVGGQLAIGLKLLGGSVIDELGIYDINPAVKARYEMELNQIDVNPELKVRAIEMEALFDSDLFLFCASKAVPQVGENVKDVRMVQFEENAKLISMYAQKARTANYKGVFGVVSDPVDLLCRQAFESSNFDTVTQKKDYLGLMPEQIVGFGLGVMDARAKYYSDQLGLKYRETGRAFGPHGKDLIVTENYFDENQEISELLTQKVIHSNLEMRAIGFKPFIAPALSSGANSIVKMLNGELHYSANFLGGVYWGGQNKREGKLVKFEKLPVSQSLFSRLERTYLQLEELWASLK
ncbi:lactate/malate family dehydrogenase [Fusibacter bizertensis]